MAHPVAKSIDKSFFTYLDINHIWANQELDQTMYLITWNPKPTFYQYDKLGENDFNKQWSTMIDLLYPSLRCLYNYCLVAEISEQGKLHLHGFYQVKDSCKYYRKFLPTLRHNGFIKKDKARSRDKKVIQYYFKDLKLTHKCIKHPIIITEETVEYWRQELMVQKLAGLKKYITPKESIGMLSYMDEHLLDNLSDL